jgi:hypothetical protein
MILSTRTDIINFLIRKCGYADYLEIGVRNPLDNFARIRARTKTGVDPAGNCDFPMTSDAFFVQNRMSFDLIFIDGLHLDHQVRKDVENSLQCLRKGGAIVLHDCNPTSPEQQVEIQHSGSWTGTVWKAFAWFRLTRPDLFMLVVDIDWGVGIIRKGNQQVFAPEPKTLDYAFLEHTRASLLNLKTPAEFVAMYSSPIQPLRAFARKIVTAVRIIR